MTMVEGVLARWIDRGTKFFRAVSKHPVIRAELLARGLTDEELKHGWALYTEINGLSSDMPARPAVPETAAAQAMNEIDAWDAPAYNAARAVLNVRFPQVEGFLFENLQASTGPSAVTGVERFLERIAALREGKADGVEPEAGRAAIELLATRKVLDAEKEARLRSLLEVVRGGARPSEVVPAPESDPRREAVAEALVAWLHEWREVARLAITRRDHLISLGLASRRQPVGDAEDEEGTDDAEPKAPEPVSG